MRSAGHVWQTRALGPCVCAGLLGRLGREGMVGREGCSLLVGLGWVGLFAGLCWDWCAGLIGFFCLGWFFVRSCYYRRVLRMTCTAAGGVSCTATVCGSGPCCQHTAGAAVCKQYARVFPAACLLTTMFRATCASTSAGVRGQVHCTHADSYAMGCCGLCHAHLSNPSMFVLIAAGHVGL